MTDGCGLLRIKCCSRLRRWVVAPSAICSALVSSQNANRRADASSQQQLHEQPNKQRSLHGRLSGLTFVLRQGEPSAPSKAPRRDLALACSTLVRPLRHFYQTGKRALAASTMGEAPNQRWPCQLETEISRICIAGQQPPKYTSSASLVQSR